MFTEKQLDELTTLVSAALEHAADRSNRKRCAILEEILERLDEIVPDEVAE
jgi:hypothetical protein